MHMKRFLRGLSLFAVLVLLCLCGCGSRRALCDAMAEAVAADETLPAGTLLCYTHTENATMSEDFLSDYLGLSGYPAFGEKIEELAVYCSLQPPYCEMAVMRVYNAADAADGLLFLERRAEQTARTLRFCGMDGYAENALVERRGNLVFLCMMPDNDRAVSALRAGLQ